MFAIYLQYIIYIYIYDYICKDTLYIYTLSIYTSVVIYIYITVYYIYICPYGYTSQLAITSISAASVVSAGAIEDCALGVAVLALNALPQGGASLGHKDRLRWGWSPLIRLNMARLLRFPWKKWCCSIAMFVYQRVSPILGMMSYDSFQLMI